MVIIKPSGGEPVWPSTEVVNHSGSLRWTKSFPKLSFGQKVQEMFRTIIFSVSMSLRPRWIIQNSPVTYEEKKNVVAKPHHTSRGQ